MEEREKMYMLNNFFAAENGIAKNVKKLLVEYDYDVLKPVQQIKQRSEKKLELDATQVQYHTELVLH